MAALTVRGVEQQPERRAPDERAADGREAPPRGLAVAVRVAQLGPGDAAARMALGEGGKGRDRARLDEHVGVRGGDERARGGGDAGVDVRPEALRLGIADDFRACGLGISAGVGDQHELVDLGRERLEARARVRVAGCPDHDRGDAAHASSSR